jgi:16S rRNA (cytosine1402-N4)-methyltransferase
MVDEVLACLQPRSGTIVDGTVGGGGHARAILTHLASFGAGSGAPPSPARWQRGLVGIDVDPSAIAEARRRLADFDNVELILASYVEMAEVVNRGASQPVTGVLLDLGASLHQLTTPSRGFSYDSPGPIDMRFNQTDARPGALARLRHASEREIRGWLRDYAQEPMSGRIAHRIWHERHSLRTTAELADLVGCVVPARLRHKALARVFQAIRIVTNSELEAVRAGLDAAIGLLAAGGRLVVLSYHSLEDGLVKGAFRRAHLLGRIGLLTRKPIRPGPAEVLRNPRARSARLRAAEVLA